MIKQHGTAVRITVRAQPRASRTEVTGELGGAVRIRVAAPPVDNAANVELVRFLARTLGVGLASVRLVTGGSGRNKIVEVDGVTAADVRRALLG
jgi:uncharacterized protein